jgi:hypothetical protein
MAEVWFGLVEEGDCDGEFGGEEEREVEEAGPRD